MHKIDKNIFTKPPQVDDWKLIRVGVVSLLLSMIFTGLVILILESGKRYDLLQLNWIKDINFQIITIRVGILYSMMLSILMFIYIFMNYNIIEKDLIKRISIAMIYLYLVSLANLIIEYIELGYAVGRFIKILEYICFIIIPCFLYFILKVFSIINERLFNAKDYHSGYINYLIRIS